MVHNLLSKMFLIPVIAYHGHRWAAGHPSGSSISSAKNTAYSQTPAHQDSTWPRNLWRNRRLQRCSSFFCDSVWSERMCKVTRIVTIFKKQFGIAKMCGGRETGIHTCGVMQRKWGRKMCEEQNVRVKTFNFASEDVYVCVCVCDWSPAVSSCRCSWQRLRLMSF